MSEHSETIKKHAEVLKKLAEPGERGSVVSESGYQQFMEHCGVTAEEQEKFNKATVALHDAQTALCFEQMQHNVQDAIDANKSPRNLSTYVNVQTPLGEDMMILKSVNESKTEPKFTTYGYLTHYCENMSTEKDAYNKEFLKENQIQLKNKIGNL